MTQLGELHCVASTCLKCGTRSVIGIHCLSAVTLKCVGIHDANGCTTGCKSVYTLIRISLGRLTTGPHDHWQIFTHATLINRSCPTASLRRRRGVVVSGVRRMNEVNARRARLVRLRPGTPSRHVTLCDPMWQDLNPLGSLGPHETNAETAENRFSRLCPVLGESSASSAADATRYWTLAVCVMSIL